LLEDGVHSPENGGLYNTIKPESVSAAQFRAFGYAKSNGSNNTTFGIFKKIENHDADSSAIISNPESTTGEHNGLREKYKNFIRQLPAKQYIEQLVATFFKEVNYQYYPLDEAIFRDHLEDWNNLSFSTLNKGPSELSGNMQFFPALLFQCLALALQFQPPDYDRNLDSIKYAAGMTFDDLANDYSESGMSIVCLLGKRHTTLVAVQAGFLRTSFLKNCGMVPESWHSLSQTIRDAQEIGLHKPTIDRHSRKPDQKPEDVLEGLWLEQLGRRMWLVLSLWDIHMAIVLGRPTTIDSRDGMPAFPIDAPIPKNRREEAPVPRGASDPPTPLTMLLWNVELGAPLWDIFNLEKEDPHQNNSAKVQKMHHLISQISIHCPPYFRAQDPDTTYDSHPDCQWLPRARATFQNSAGFTIMALHRPYIFTNSSSRTLALKAGLDILRAQRTFFSLVRSEHYKMFYSLVLHTFDAIVLVAAIYILHPYENPDDLEDALQHFEWAMERFQAMSSRNGQAKVALGVLKAIYVRLKKALNQPKPSPLSKPLPPSSATSASTPPIPTPEPLEPYNQFATSLTHPSISSASPTSTNQSSSTAGSSSTNTSTSYTLPTISNLTEAIPTTSWEPAPYPPISSINFSNITPLQPMHDLLYNDLGTLDVGLDTATLDPGLWNGEVGGGVGVGMGQLQFEGDFGNDSFWGFMNSYNP